jgi:hypothetical protein
VKYCYGNQRATAFHSACHVLLPSLSAQRPFQPGHWRRPSQRDIRKRDLSRLPQDSFERLYHKMSASEQQQPRVHRFVIRRREMSQGRRDRVYHSDRPQRGGHWCTRDNCVGKSSAAVHQTEHHFTPRERLSRVCGNTWYRSIESGLQIVYA